MLKRWYILRHGETAQNKQGIVQGSGVDSSLNEDGLSQAHAFARMYDPLVKFDMVVTSNLKRTIETVSPFIEKGIPHLTMPDLREISWGINEGHLPTEDIMQRYHDTINHWVSGDYDVKVENGESATELATRMQRAIDLLKEINLDNILICTHGRTIRCLMCLIMGLPISDMETISHHNTGLYIVEVENEKMRVILKDDTKHYSLIAQHG